MNPAWDARRSDEWLESASPSPADPNGLDPSVHAALSPRSLSAVDRHLGERLRARRTAIGMSQERLAQLVGAASQQVQKYERGENRIPASRLSVIAAALQTDALFFYCGLVSSSPSPTEEASDVPLLRALATREGRELAALLLATENPRLRESIAALVRAVAASY